MMRSVILHITDMIVSRDLDAVLPTPRAISIALCDPPHSTESSCLALHLLSALQVKWGENQ